MMIIAMFCVGCTIDVKPLPKPKPKVVYVHHYGHKHHHKATPTPGPNLRGTHYMQPEGETKLLPAPTP